MSDAFIIGPNACLTCGGRYGKHAEWCSKGIKERKLKSKRPAPQWYTAEELRHYLIRMDYAPSIASELAAGYAVNLQRAFEKGFEKGQREQGKAL